MILVKSFACLSDVRVRKILFSLDVNKKDVLYSGAFHCDNVENFKYKNVRYNLIQRRSSITSLLKVSFLDIKFLLSLKSNDTVYFVDESIAIILFPFLFLLKAKRVNIVIDLFDSYYLKSNKNFFVKYLLKFVYHLCNKIIVTDSNRAIMMGELISTPKLLVIENFPFYNEFTFPKVASDKIRLFFYGSLHESRGWNFIKQFENNNNFIVYLAGWNNFANENIDSLAPNFKYLGLMSQMETLNFMYSDIDWIFCLYEPSNINNINASPNKIYDAIHTGCGIIINREVISSSFVSDNNFGIVIENYTDNATNYFKIIMDKQFNLCNSKEQLRRYCFDQYLTYFNTL